MSILNLSPINKIKNAVQSELAATSLPYGKNLFNKESVAKNLMINSDGADVGTANIYVSNYIPIIGGAKIKLSAVRNNASLHSAFYDENKNVILDSVKANTQLVLENGIRVAPENASYFRFSNHMFDGESVPDKMQVEYGEETTKYESYSRLPRTPNFLEPQDVILSQEVMDKVDKLAVEAISPFKAVTIPYGKNLFNKETITSTSRIAPSGVVEPSQDIVYVSDYIPVLGETTIKITPISGSPTIYNGFYDANKNPIVTSIISNADLYLQSFKRKVPKEAVYYRFSSTTNTRPVDAIQVEYGDVSTSYEPFSPMPKTPNFQNPQDVNVVNENTKITGYDTISNTNDYEILTHREGNEIMAARKNGVRRKGVFMYKDTIVSVSGKTIGSNIYIHEDGLNSEPSYTVVFNNVNFPDLKDDSLIAHIIFVPYTRNMQLYVQEGWNARIVVVTTKGQIYHNYPSRAVDSDGQELPGDIAKFDHSVIWELKGRKFPSTDPNASGVEIYTPGLPMENYEYVPAISKDNGYGNGGFPKQTTHGDNTYARFYEPQKNIYHSFNFMGGMETTEKITLVGTYRSNTVREQASRICLFSTSDGGRQWYCKYEFAGGNVGTQNTGVQIDSSDDRYDNHSVGSFADYTADSFVVKKVTHVVPSATNKEPTSLFDLSDGFVISSITKGKPTVVKTSTPHGFTENQLIVIQDNGASSNVSPDWDWLKNDTLTTTSGGNGRMFKVDVISSVEFSLREHFHNPFNNLYCRHIHSINRLKDGFTLGCGENYPNGWIFYIPSHVRESGSRIYGYDDLELIRLTSTADSVARPLGFIMKDDADNTVYFGSDEAHLPRPNLNLPEGRNVEVTRNSNGVFSGKLSDCDDFSKFTCIFEAEEPCYFFKEKLNVWIFGGQRGEAAFSFDKGKTWVRDSFGLTTEHYKGSLNNMVFISKAIVIIKK